MLTPVTANTSIANRAKAPSGPRVVTPPSSRAVATASAISPAIFGSMFQSVMDAKARRNLGAHYTSEKNILKLIGPLFLDALTDELDKAGHDEKKLAQLHRKLATLKA